MSSVKNLKKDINYVLGDVIEMCYVWEFSHPKQKTNKTEKIIDEAIELFDALIKKVNQGRKAEDKKAHYYSIQKELEETASKFIEDIDKL